MVSNEALRALLDELAASRDQDAQLTILRAWLGTFLRSWEAQKSEEQQETLGKLAGG